MGEQSPKPYRPKSGGNSPRTALLGYNRCPSEELNETIVISPDSPREKSIREDSIQDKPMPEQWAELGSQSGSYCAPTKGQDGPPGGKLCVRIQDKIEPLPARVMLDEHAVRIHSSEWINWAIGAGLIEDRDIVTRTILVRSNTFKETLQKLVDRTGKGGYPNFLVRFARGLPMPRYIWLVELSYTDDVDPGDSNSPEVIAHLMLDCTSTETIRPDYLMLHFPNVALGRPRLGGATQPPFDMDVKDHPHAPFPDMARPRICGRSSQNHWHGVAGSGRAGIRPRTLGYTRLEQRPAVLSSRLPSRHFQ